MLKEPKWTNTTVIDGNGDVAGEIRALKARPGQELQVHGSGTLARWLLENGLVDELNLLIFPVIVGDGTRLFPDKGAATGLTLKESRTAGSGTTMQVYAPAGPAEYGTASVT